jgi:hypothetical protein
MVLMIANKIEVAPAYSFKVYRGKRSTAPFILNMVTSWNGVFNFTPQPIYPRGISLIPCGIRTPRLAYRILVTILTLLFQLLGL